MMSKALVQTLAGGVELPTLKFDTAAGDDGGGGCQGEMRCLSPDNPIFQPLCPQTAPGLTVNQPGWS